MPITSYEDALIAAQEAEARAAELRKRSQERPEGQMVSGFYVRPHWTSALVPILNKIAGGQKSEKAAALKKQGTELMEEDYQKWLSSRPQPALQQGQGPLLEPNIDEPTDQQNIEWAGRGMKNPLSKALAAKYGEEVLIGGPARKEKAQEAAQLKHDTLQNQLTIAREKNEMMKEHYAGILANQAASLEQKKEATAALNALKEQGLELARQGLALREQGLAQGLKIAEMVDATKRYGIDQRLQQNRAKMSDKTRSELDEADGLISGMDLADSKLAKVKDSPVGSFATAVGANITDKVFGGGGQRVAAATRSKEENEARSMAFDLASGVQHGRYGTALSKTESSQAARYLPTDFDDAPEIRRKLAGVRRLIELNHRRLKLMESGGISLTEAQRTYPFEAEAEPEGKSSAPTKDKVFNPKTGRLE